MSDISHLIVWLVMLVSCHGGGWILIVDRQIDWHIYIYDIFDICQMPHMIIWHILLETFKPQAVKPGALRRGDWEARLCSSVHAARRRVVRLATNSEAYLHGMSWLEEHRHQRECSKVFWAIAVNSSRAVYHGSQHRSSFEHCNCNVLFFERMKFDKTRCIGQQMSAVFDFLQSRSLDIWYNLI